jgi:pimeloyl-ACP methyl ester carboxylesterase
MAERHVTGVQGPFVQGVRGIALAGALVFGLIAPVSADEERANEGSRLQLHECRLQHPQRLLSIEARCANFEVPENPAEPAGRQIQLRVAVVPALNRRGPTDPLFVLAGGPGQAATDFYAATAPAFARVQRDRDIVLVDQRGTGASNPLTCEYPEEEELADLTGEQIRKYTKNCLSVVQRRGNVSFYTTSVAVRDLDAVRGALGYESINLYGVSYGTRVAQHYLRRYPQRTRTLVLDGVVPPQQILAIDSSLQAERALAEIFGRCLADDACHRAFPDPAGEFRKLRQALSRKSAEVTVADPVAGKVTTEPFRLVHLQTAVRLLSYSPERAALLPLLIYEGARNNLAPLAAQAQMVSESIEQTISYGMHHSVVCTEDAPFFTSSAVDRHRLEQTYLGTTQLDGLIAICEVWPRGLMDPDFHAPVVSDVPVLLLSGSADPVTPPPYGDLARQKLRNSVHLILPGQGHGQIVVGCMPRLVAEFIGAGTTEGLDSECAKQVTPTPFFTSFAGPPP